MLTVKDRRARYREIEDLQKRRAANIARFAERFGWEGLAKACGESAAFLQAIAGPNRTRAFTPALARRLERRLGITQNWLDEYDGQGKRCGGIEWVP